MKKKIINRLGLFALVTVAGALTACGGSNGGSNSTITTVNILVFNGTGGKDWIVNATKRFSEANKETSFQEGKKGINFKIRSAKGINFNTEMKSSGDDIFIYETYPDMYQLSAQKYLLDISDVVTPLESKIEPDLLERMKGVDGKYYGLPHYEWFPGISYDKDLFEQNNYYFADPNVDNEDKDLYSSKYGDAYFVAGKDVKKSVGPNGIAGDYDDGLPSSLEEFNILCDKMVSDSVSPLILCGGGQYYSWYFPMALWASLTGGDGMRDIYCNWTDAELDVVTGWSTEDAFYKGSGIKKPSTAKKSLNDDSGYQMYDMATRYYSLAYFEMALENKWIDADQLSNPNGSSTEAMNWFINGNKGKRYGMLWDGSYWCHEAADVGTFDFYAQRNPEAPDRHTAFMPLPTQLMGQVKEGKGKKPTLLNVGSTLTFANARVAKNGKITAVKEFLKFIYSDNELASFSELTGLTVPMDYSYNMSGLNNSYYSDLATYRADADVIQCASASPRFKKNLTSFIISYTMTLNNFTAADGTAVSGGYLNAFRYQGCDSKYIFETTRLSKENWDKMSK